jgi:hypothetical protein
MRVREFFTCQSGEFGFLWKYQMFVGILLILLGIMIVLFPEILVALAATAVLMVGAGLVGSAWRLRRLGQRSRGFSLMETWEW